MWVRVGAHKGEDGGLRSQKNAYQEPPRSSWRCHGNADTRITLWNQWVCEGSGGLLPLEFNPSLKSIKSHHRPVCERVCTSDHRGRMYAWSMNNPYRPMDCCLACSPSPPSYSHSLQSRPTLDRQTLKLPVSSCWGQINRLRTWPRHVDGLLLSQQERT